MKFSIVKSDKMVAIIQQRDGSAVGNRRSPAQMNILMLSWRDMKHPKKGGAEIVTDKYLSYFAKNKDSNITLFSSSFEGAEPEETYNNYKIIRKGNQLTCHLHALAYAKKHEKDFDTIIDQVNTIPFFTPLLIRKSKRVAYFNQLCKNIWFYESKFPINIVGYVLESIYLKLYKNTRILTISQSSKQDLIKYAWAKPENIFISEMQIDFQPISQIHKKQNQFVFCGRLVKSKRVHDCIKAMALINSNNKEIKLIVIGDGNKRYKDYLMKLTNKLNLNDKVIFTNSISNQDRNKLMGESLAILVTSVREGWGLIVTEANANGTLAITYNTQGLRDANKAGIITKQNTPEALAQEMNKIISEDNKLMLKLSKASLADSHNHDNWNKQCMRVERWMKRK